MFRRRPAAAALTVALLALLALGCAQRAVARLGILWRTAVLSWDSPATQLEDEAASQGALHEDPGGRARAHAVGASVSTGRIVIPAPIVVIDAGNRSGRLTRSPPAS